MVDHVGVQWVIAGDENRGPLLAGAAGPSRLLPQGGQGAGPAGHDDHIEPGYVDAQLQRVRRRDGAQLAVAQGGFQHAALFWQIAAAVGRNCFCQFRCDGFDFLADGRGEGFRSLSRCDEGNRAVAGARGVGEHVGGFGNRGAAGCIRGNSEVPVVRAWQQRRFPQDEFSGGARGAVLGDCRGWSTGQPREGFGRFAHGGRCADDHRLGTVVFGYAQQSPQHECHVRTENTPIPVRFVDDDEPQGLEPAGIAGVGRKD